MIFRKRTYSKEELISGCLQNDRKYQEAFYTAYFDVAAGVCKKYTRDENEILSLVNDCFLKIFKNLHTFENTGSLEGWIKKIMYHIIIDHFRYYDKKLAFLVPVDKMPDMSTNENVLHELIVAELLNLLDKLPPNSARVLKLFALDGYSHADISKMLDISEGTSRWHVAQARQLLKRIIEDYHNEHSKRIYT